MRVIIAGGRDVTGEKAETLVRAAIAGSGWVNEIAQVINGAAPGIDSAAQRVCTGIWPVVSVPAEWAAYGRAAGPMRNRKMAGMADSLIAIWDGKSRGTMNMISTATKLGLKVYVHRYT